MCFVFACGGALPVAPAPTPPAAPANASTASPKVNDAAVQPKDDPLVPEPPNRADSVALAAAKDASFPSGLVVDEELVGGSAPGPDLPKDTRVLHIGDSFAGALGVELNKVLSRAGLKTRLEFEQSTYIPTWAHSKKLGGLLTTFKPDLVIISLGANELEIPEPEKRAPLIQKLVKSLGETPCVWVAPVLWDGAKANLLEVIRANVGSCVYLDSNRLVRRMPRARDGIHPSMAVRPDWATVTARWLAYHRQPTATLPWTLVP